jgi:signal transduction histidine kinase
VSYSRRRVLTLLGVAAGVALVIAAARSWNPGIDPRIVIADLAVGFVFIGGGIAAWTFRPTSGAGPLLIMVGASWFAGTIWPILEFLHRGPLFHVLATYPTGRLSWRAGDVGDRIRVMMVLAAYAAHLTPLGGDVAVVWALTAALLWLAADALLRTHGTMRRAKLGAGAGAIGVGLVVFAGAIGRVAGAPLGLTGLFAYDAILVVTGLGLAGDLLAGRWSQGVLTRAVVDLGDAALAGSVRDRLARSLGDPSLFLAYAISGQPDSFVDELGRPVSLPPPSAGRAVTPMVVAGRQTGFIAHDAAVLNDPRLVEALSAAAGLAMSNSTLQAEVRARVAEVTASRERLVHAADSQRRRIEHRLQLGAARHLERVAELLARVEPADPAAERACLALRGELDRARSELANFARGVHPATLTSAGLTAALAELIRRTPLNVELTAAVQPADALTEATLYFICSEALANAAKHADAARVVIDVRQTDGSVRLVVSDDGGGGARIASRGGLRGLADRVEVLGGVFGVESEPGAGTTLRIDLPQREAAAAAPLIPAGRT